MAATAIRMQMFKRRGEVRNTRKGDGPPQLSKQRYVLSWEREGAAPTASLFVPSARLDSSTEVRKKIMVRKQRGKNQNPRAKCQDRNTKDPNVKETRGL
jgi:hypothetical protein